MNKDASNAKPVTLPEGSKGNYQLATDKAAKKNNILLSGKS